MNQETNFNRDELVFKYEAMRIKFNHIFILISCCLLFSCATEGIPDLETPKAGYSFTATIEGFETPETRAAIGPDPDYDHWTLKKFQSGDEVGFYSEFGNNVEDTDQFLNVPLQYGNNSFYNYDLDINTDNVATDRTLYYYPYSEFIDYDPEITRYTPGQDYGLELRQKCDDNIERCFDMLWVYSASSVTTQRFNHAFSSLVFLRGEGFDNPDPDKFGIKIGLSKGFSHVTISDDDYTSHKYFKVTKLIYLEGYKTEEQCRVWDAWKGDDYLVTNENDPYYGMKFENAYYVIVPTMLSNGRVTVDYIELYDNNNVPRRITNFVLYGDNTKNLHPGQRYPLLIKMQNLEPVITSIGIEPWGEDNLIQEERATGISSVSEFTDWALNYSLYVDNNRVASENIREKLEKYGDQTIEADEVTVKWTFYLNNDIDLGDYISQNPNINNLLVKLDDCLEGNNFTITGLDINSPSPPSFIGELGEKGIIRNLNVRGMNLKCTDSSKTSPSGGLINICRGTVENCDLDGVVSGYGKVGMLAAQGDNATVKNCSFRGLLIGTSNENQGIFGEQINCNFRNMGNHSSVIFQPVD